MKEFKDLGLGQDLLKAIERLGITTPTLIQEKSIPPIIKGKDIIGESATGSGKTIAFGAGIVENVVPKAGLQALVLTPTRELAEQVRGALEELTRKGSLHITSVYGGVAIGPQMDALRTAEVAVATPGRMLDHMERRTVDLSKIKIVVLDEADRMLDMGFIDDVEKIIRQCPKERQTMFFSATISDRIKRLADNHMKNPLKITATRMVDPSKLKQVYYDIPKNLKLSVLVHLYKKEPAGLAMVFCNTRRTTEFVVKNLKANKVDAIAIHGGMTQNKRTKTIEDFNRGKAGLLVCTDVAARGLHVDNVSHVYNYEIPADPTDYVHRIGRTARAGEKGEVVNLICDLDHDNFSRVMWEHRDYHIRKAEKPKVERVMAIKEDRSRRFSKGGPRRFGNSRGGFRGRPRNGHRPHRRMHN